MLRLDALTSVGVLPQGRSTRSRGTFLPTENSLHALEIDGRIRILGLVQDRSEHRQRGPAD
jgi:hypothetical protein